MQTHDGKERGEISLDKEGYSVGLLPIGGAPDDFRPLADDSTADAEPVLGVVPRPFDHLRIRERNIGVNPLPLLWHW